jgi:predicted RNA-binding Zn-ribbon protein involved in translation (DUF1610 family)
LFFKLLRPPWRQLTVEKGAHLGKPSRKAYHNKQWAEKKAIGLQLHWQSAPAGKQAKAKRASKTKFTCPNCGQNAWAKPDSLLICGACYEMGEGNISLMLAKLGEDAEVA